MAQKAKMMMMALLMLLTVVLHAVTATYVPIRKPQLLKGEDKKNATKFDWKKYEKQKRYFKRECFFLMKLGLRKDDLIVTVNAEEGDTVALPCHYCGAYTLQEKRWSVSPFRWGWIWEYKKYFNPGTIDADKEVIKARMRRQLTKRLRSMGETLVSEKVDTIMSNLTMKKWEAAMGIKEVDYQKFSLLSELADNKLTERKVKRQDNALVIYNVQKEDIGAYTCHPSHKIDIQEGTWTYIVDRVEPKGYFTVREGNEKDYEVYKQDVAYKYNKFLKSQMKHDSGFLQDTMLVATEGKVSECSTCGGEIGVQSVDIELMLIHRKAPNVVKRINQTRSLKRRRLTPRMFMDFDKEYYSLMNNSEILRSGLHIRSSFLKEKAPYFIANAKRKFEEFKLIKPCKSVQPCEKAGVYGMAPEKFVDDKPTKEIYIVSLGDPVELKCPVDEDNDNRIVWFHNRKFVQESGRVVVYRDSVRIKTVALNDTGNFTCFMEVKVGPKEKVVLKPVGSVFLEVNEKVARAEMFMIMQHLVTIFVVIMIIQIPLTFINPVQAWYQKEAMTNAHLKMVYQQLEMRKNQGELRDAYEEALKKRRLGEMMGAMESGDMERMVLVEKKYRHVMELGEVERTMLLVLSRQIWKLEK